MRIRYIEVVVVLDDDDKKWYDDPTTNVQSKVEGFIRDRLNPGSKMEVAVTIKDSKSNFLTDGEIEL